MRTHAAFIFCVTLFLTNGLWGQSKIVSLEEARQMALENNINVVQTKNNIDAAKANVQAAYGGYLPSLSASGNWSRTQSQRTDELVQIIEGQPVNRQQEFFGVENSWGTGASTSLTVFDGFAREARVSGSKSQQTSAEMTSVRTRQAIAYQVTAGYLNILRTRELVRVSEENLKRDQRQLERITESNRVGALSMADVYRQQSQVANDELDVINAQNNHAKAKADLVALTGLDPSQEYEFSDPSIKSEMDSAAVEGTMLKYKNLTDITKSAVANRPDFVAATENLNAATSGVTAAKSGYWPSVSAFGSYGNFANTASQLALTRNYTLSWGVGLRWNIFDRFSREQSIQSAMVSKRNAEIEVTQVERDISVEVRKALLDLDASKKSWEVSQKVLLSASEDRKIAEERYNLGAGTLLDLLVANATFVGAQATRINAVTGFLISKYNVEYALAEKAY
jgi:outer membrane protein